MKKNIPLNKIVPSMTQVDFSDMDLPLAVIYNRPDDFPDRVVARIREGRIDCSTNVCCMYQTVEESRKDLQKAGFVLLMPRDERDVRSIVETWIKK